MGKDGIGSDHLLEEITGNGVKKTPEIAHPRERDRERKVESFGQV